MNPQYIKLTAVRVTMPPATDQRGRPIGQAEVKILQPPVVQLIPLPVAFNKGQVDGRAERNDSGVAVTYRELFDDVLNAIGEAEKLGRAIALPIDRQMIDAAAASARPKAPIIPLTVQEAVETAVNGVKAAIDSQEEDCMHAAPGAAQADENDPRWNDFVQTDGEDVGKPAYSRKPRVGDLRISRCTDAQAPAGRFFLEQAFEKANEDAASLERSIYWAAPSLPFNLMRSFDSRDELIETVHASGRGNLLVNE